MKKRLTTFKKYLIVLCVLTIIGFLPLLVDRAAYLAASLINNHLDKSHREDMRKWMRARNGFEQLDIDTQRRLTAAGVKTIRAHELAGASGEGKVMERDGR
jgi:hypothetical protein